MQWYYATEGQRHGPLAADEFARLVEAGTVAGSTLVWREGMPAWQPWSEVAPAAAPAAGGDAPDAGVPPELPPVAAPAVAAPPAAEPGPEFVAPVEFSGTAAEYFRIWIVNLLLTVVTLGIYAAWAKVRTRQYFAAHTRLLGHAFDYTANPLRILIGNVIVLGMAAVYGWAGTISPGVVALVLLLFLAIFPWLLVKSVAFNARNTRYRGLRFGFDGRVGEAARLFLLYPVLSAFTLHLLYPWVAREQRTYLVGRHRFGRTGFSFAGTTRGYYRIFLRAAALIAPLVVCYFALIVGVALQKSVSGVQLWIGFAALALLPAMLAAVAGRFYYYTTMFNYVWNHTQVGRHGFVAKLRAGPMAWMQLGNACAVLCSLGLLYPWAKIRELRFILGNLQVVPRGGWEEFVAGAEADEPALGDAASDFFDFGIGLGL